MISTRKEQRRSGAHARALARGAAYVRLFYLALSGLALYLGYHAITVKPLQVIDRPLLAVAVILLSLSLFQASKERGRSVRARVGATNESRVARALLRMNFNNLANSAMLGVGGDADHVVMGPCLVVIETKTGRGPLSVRGRSLVVGARTIPGDPVSQAKRQAMAVGRIAEMFCDAVVCVPDATGPVRSDRGVTICSLAQLGQVLRALPARLSPQDAANLNERLHAVDLAHR